MARISIISSSFCKNEELCNYASQELAHHELLFADGSHLVGNNLLQLLVNADAALIGREPITETVLKTCSSLKTLSLYGVGHDNVDLGACSRYKVKLLVRHGVNAAAVAEHTIGLMLAVMRNIAYTDRLLHSGIWHKNGGRQLTGSTIGIIGCGHVGSEVARLLTAFKCRLLLNDIRDVTALAAETKGIAADFNTCIESADVVTVHVPLTPITVGMFKSQVFERMRPQSILINTSRGGVVILNELKKALIDNKLAGAALDVFESEPLTDPEIYSLERLVTTPHIAGNSKEAVAAMGRAAVDQLRDCLLHNPT